MSEDAAAERLVKAGYGISRPGDGAPGNPLKECWGVFSGSHGGFAPRLVDAMRDCMACCGIGRWWKLDGVSMQRTFGAIAREHLGWRGAFTGKKSGWD